MPKKRSKPATPRDTVARLRSERDLLVSGYLAVWSNPGPRWVFDASTRFEWSLPLPLNWCHQSDMPLGLVHYLKPDKHGLKIKATLTLPSPTLISWLRTFRLGWSL